MINKHTIIDYINYLRRSGISNTTINSYLRGIRAVIYYYIELGYTVPFKINLVKTDKPIKQTYTDYELQLLLKKPNINQCSFTEYRNWVVINYLLGTGNRVSTVVNIKIHDIDFSSETIILTKTKNRKQQVIPLSRTLILVLREFMKYRKGTDDDYLFCNIYGNKLNSLGLEKAINNYNKSRGVTKTSLHLFRHTFAKKWILNGR